VVWLWKVDKLAEPVAYEDCSLTKLGGPVVNRVDLEEIDSVFTIRTLNEIMHPKIDD
jgi:hypothetical protein